MPRGDAALVAKLKAAGAIVLGKTNVTELGGLFDANMPEGYSSLGGQVLLPSDTDKTPAGSSAGSAAATAAGPGGADGRPGDLDRHRADDRAGGRRRRRRAQADGRAASTATACSASRGRRTRRARSRARCPTRRPRTAALSGHERTAVRDGAERQARGRDQLDHGAVPGRGDGGHGARRDDGRPRRSARRRRTRRASSRAVRARPQRVPRRRVRRRRLAAGDRQLQRREPGRGAQVPAARAGRGAVARPVGVRRPTWPPGKASNAARDRRAARRHRRDHGPERQRAGRDRRPRRLPGPDRPGRLRHGRRGPQPDRRDVRRRGAASEAGAARRRLRVRAGDERAARAELHEPEHVPLRRGEHVLLAAPLPPGRPAERRRRSARPRRRSPATSAAPCRRRSR